MRGDTTETSNLDRILQQIQIQNSNPSSFPPSDMSTRTDIGLLQPQKEKSLPWWDFSNLPVWEGTLPKISPEELEYQISELRADMTPGEGQYRSAKRSAQETAKAEGLLSQGKYLEALPHGIWAGVESLDVALSTLPVAGVALDLARAGKRMLTSTAKKQEAIINQGIRNLPTLRKAINQARKEKHLINDHSKGAKGQFVGGPRGFKSKAQIEKMRNEFDAQVAGGVLGADWYDRVRTMTRGVSGGSRQKEDRLSEALALWSAQAQPRPNLNWSFEALNNWAAGKGINFPEKIKTTAQARKFLEGMLSGEQIKLGKKTGVYKQSLDPNVETPITGTNDIWHGRAFGYVNNDGKPISRGFTPQEHVFLDNETVLAVDRANKAKLGGRSNWTAAEIQAAAWVYAKGKSQFAKYPNKFNGNLDEAIEWAKQTYPDELHRQLAFGTREYIPGAGTGHLAKVTKSDPATRKEYSDEISGTLGTDEDVITGATGLYSKGVRPATGVFKSHTGQFEFNQAQVNQAIIDLVNDEGGRTISDVSQSFMNAIEGIHGYINMQNGSAWHKFIPFQKGGGVKSSVSNSIQVHTGAPLDEGRMRVLAEWADERGMILSDNGKSVVLWPDEWGSKPSLWSAGEEVIPEGGLPDGRKMSRLLEGKKATKKREAVSGWQEELADILQVDISEIDRGRVISGYIDYEDVTKLEDLTDSQRLLEQQMPGRHTLSNSSPRNAGRALRTDTVLKLLDDPNIPAVLDSIDSSPEFRQLILDNIARATDWSKKMKSPLRQDHMNALKILAEEGFKGLRKAMKNGAVLPAVALPIFGAGFQVQQEQQE